MVFYKTENLLLYHPNVTAQQTLSLSLSIYNTISIEQETLSIGAKQTLHSRT